MTKKLPGKILAYIPIRKGSKRVTNKNAKVFAGKPLMSHTVELAKQCDAIDRIVIDTDCQEYADIAKSLGVPVPWLRPEHLARDSAKIIDTILLTLDRLKEKEGYEPEYLMILQVTSPLRELSDIEAVISDMAKGGATTVLTVSETHPRLYHLDKNNFIELANKNDIGSTNTQDWKKGYLQNGCIVYLINVKVMREERSVVTKKTRAVITPKWRSIDIDNPEDWVMAELVYKHRGEIYDQLKRF